MVRLDKDDLILVIHDRDQIASSGFKIELGGYLQHRYIIVSLTQKLSYLLILERMILL